MKIRDVLEFARKNLQVQSPLKEANILLAHHLKKTKEWVFVHEDDVVEKEKAFLKLVKKRSKGVPLEYLTKKVSFYSKDFFIKKGVLIPRPETEILVDKALENIKDIKNPKILEIGTGSGIIAIMIALLRDDANVVATDINKKALKVAVKNAIKFGVEKKIIFFHTSLDTRILGEFDLLVSNPPYIAFHEVLEKQVLKEPKKALFSGKDGTRMLKKIVKIAKRRKIPKLCCEMGYDQRQKMKAFFEKLALKEFEFYNDLSSLDRGFTIKF